MKVFLLCKKEIVKGDYDRHENYFVKGIYADREKAQKQIKKLTTGMIRAASFDPEDITFETERGYVEYSVHCFNVDANYQRELIGTSSYCI